MGKMQNPSVVVAIRTTLVCLEDLTHVTVRVTRFGSMRFGAVKLLESAPTGEYVSFTTESIYSF